MQKRALVFSVHFVAGLIVTNALNRFSIGFEDLAVWAECQIL